MKDISLEELLEAGCHFGHQVTRSNPKARDFVFEARDNIHIIDLAKTKQGLEEAGEYVKSLAAKGGSLLVVATKRQAQGIIQTEIARVKEVLEEGSKPQDDSLYYVTNRWIGGILTNLSEVSKNFKKLEDLKDKLQNKEEKAKYTKREIGLWEKEKQRLENLYGGVSGLKEKPNAMFIIDSHLEELAVKEARNMGVTTVAVVDTNADPSIIDYPIPANDDAVGSIQLIVAFIMDAWIEGRKAFGVKAQKEEAREKKAEAKEIKPKETPKKAEKEEEKPTPKKTKKEKGKKK